MDDHYWKKKINARQQTPPLSPEQRDEEGPGLGDTFWLSEKTSDTDLTISSRGGYVQQASGYLRTGVGRTADFVGGTAAGAFETTKDLVARPGDAPARLVSGLKQAHGAVFQGAGRIVSAGRRIGKEKGIKLESLSRSAASAGASGLSKLTDLAASPIDSLADLAHAPQVSRAVRNSQLKKKLQIGLGLSLASQEDIRMLFESIDSNGSGFLSIEEIVVAAGELFVSPSVPEKEKIRIAAGIAKQMVAFADIDDGCLDWREFEIALRYALQLQSEALSHENRLLSGVSARGMHNYLLNESDTKESCNSLPMTMTIYVLYFTIVQVHLKVERVHKTINTMEETYAYPRKGKRWQSDLSSHFYDWMLNDFLPNMYSTDYDPDDKGVLPGLVPPFAIPGRIAAYNQMLGGVRLKQFRAKPGRCKDDPCRDAIGSCDSVGPKVSLIELYDQRDISAKSDAKIPMCRSESEEESAIWISSQLSYFDANSTVLKLQRLEWIDEFTNRIAVTIPTYNGETGTFAMSELSISNTVHGAVTTKFQGVGWATDPFADDDGSVYRNIYGFPYMVTAMFVLVVLLMVFMEIRRGYVLYKRTTSYRNWLGRYLNIWSIIDLTSIFGTLSVIGMYAIVIIDLGSLRQTIIKSPLVHESDSFRLDLDQIKMQLSNAKTDTFQEGGMRYEDYLTVYLDGICDSFVSLSYQWTYLRYLCMPFTISIILRFFKTFRMNKRLSGMTMTLAVVGVDLFHYLLVVTVVFLCFCMLGHIWFGGHVLKDGEIGLFQTPLSSMNTLFLLICGENPFWEMAGDGKGIRFLYAIIFYYFYVFTFVLLMLNLLIAMIMDAFVAVKSGADNSNNPTIWAQAIQMYHSYEAWQKFVIEASLDGNRTTNISTFDRCFTEFQGSGLHGDDIVTVDVLLEKTELTPADAERMISQAILFEAHEMSGEIQTRMADALRIIFALDARIQNTLKHIEDLADLVPFAVRQRREKPALLAEHCVRLLALIRQLQVKIPELPLPSTKKTSAFANKSIEDSSFGPSIQRRRDASNTFRNRRKVFVAPKQRVPKKNRWRQEGDDENHDGPKSEAPEWLGEYDLFPNPEPRWQQHGASDTVTRRQYQDARGPWVEPPPPPVYLTGYGYYLPNDAHLSGARKQRNSLDLGEDEDYDELSPRSSEG